MDKSISIETHADAPDSTGSDAKRRSERKLSLKVDVIRTLSDSEMGHVAGGWILPGLPSSVSTIIH